MIDDSVLAVGSTSAVSSAVLRRARHLDFFENVVLTDYSFYGRNARTRTGTVEESPVLALFQSKIHPPLGAAVRSYIYTRTHIIVYSENGTRLVRSTTSLLKVPVPAKNHVDLYCSLFFHSYLFHTSRAQY